jgi:hypothetical protein
MPKAIRVGVSGFLSSLLLLLGSAGWAQQLAGRPRQTAMRNLAYDASQETVAEGTVLRFTAESDTPPIGAHFVLQTAASTIDVHLCAASFLQANHFSLAKGDPVRIVGVSSTTGQGAVFLARVIQKGGQSLVVRTANGAPLSLARARPLGGQKTQQQEGAR